MPRRGRRLTDRMAEKEAVHERNERMWEMYLKGFRLDEIIAFSGLCSSRATKILQQFRDETDGPCRNPRVVGAEATERNKKIIGLYRSGVAIKRIAEMVHCDKSTVSLAIRNARNAVKPPEEDNSPLPPRPRNFGAVKAPKLKIPPLEQGKLYSLPEFCDKNRSGGRRPPARIMRFIGFVPGAGVRHALFLHPVAGYRETFREFDLQRVQRVRRFS